MVVMTSVNSDVTKSVDVYMHCIKNCHVCTGKDAHGNVAGTSKHYMKQDDLPKQTRNFLCENIVLPKIIKLIKGSSRDAVGLLKDIQDFELLELLGEGFFGKVYKVRDKTLNGADSNANIMVMKIPILNNQSCRLSGKKIVIKEDYMLRLLQHPNILKSRGICVQRLNSQWQLNLLVDFCDAGSLQQLILNLQKSFSWLQRCKIGLDVCEAMNYVHEQKFMHRDLTSMNILLKSQSYSIFFKAVVADFGLSSKIPQYPNVLQQVGTQNWMAPEMLKEKFYNEKSDVFSFGIIMCQMIARIDADHDAGLYRTPMFGLDYVRFITRCPSETPLELLKIAFMCCVWNPDSRPSFTNLVNQLAEVVNQNINQNTFPRENIPTAEEISNNFIGKEKFSLLSRNINLGLGRSRSDAAIRVMDNFTLSRNNLPSNIYDLASYTPQKICSSKTSFFSKTLNRQKIFNSPFEIEDYLKQHNSEPTPPVIHEAVVMDGFPTMKISNNFEVSEFIGNEDNIENCASNRLKELATLVANEDPNYQESEQNPFSAHFRYRSIRKMKPTNLFKNVYSFRLKKLDDNVNNPIKITTACISNDFLIYNNDSKLNKMVNKILLNDSNISKICLMEQSTYNRQDIADVDSTNEESKLDGLMVRNQLEVDLRSQNRYYNRIRSYSLPPSFTFCLDLSNKQTTKNFEPQIETEFDSNIEMNNIARFDDSNILHNKQFVSDVRNENNSINYSRIACIDSEFCFPSSSFLKKKTSITLGLGEQRDLQGRITLSFRDYDHKFTSGKYMRCHEVDMLQPQKFDLFNLSHKKKAYDGLEEENSKTLLNLHIETGNVQYSMVSSRDLTLNLPSPSLYIESNNEGAKKTDEWNGKFISNRIESFLAKTSDAVVDLPLIKSNSTIDGHFNNNVNLIKTVPALVNLSETVV